MEQLDVSNFCKTKSQAHDLVARLGTVTEKIYETSFNLEKTLQEVFGMKQKDILLTLLHKENIRTDSASELKSFFLRLQKTIAELPVITLTIAFEPQEKTLQVLSDWFAMNLKKQMLFDIEVDPSLLAGAKIKYNGTYVDLSTKPIFDKMLTEFLNQNIKLTAKEPPKQETPEPQVGDNFSLGR